MLAVEVATAALLQIAANILIPGGLLIALLKLGPERRSTEAATHHQEVETARVVIAELRLELERRDTRYAKLEAESERRYAQHAVEIAAAKAERRELDLRLEAAERELYAFREDMRQRTLPGSSEHLDRRRSPLDSRGDG